MHRKLGLAKSKRDDEFYTPYDYVDDELSAYPLETWRGKTVVCPCDSERSAFRRWFLERFDELGLEALVCSAYEPDGHGRWERWDGSEWVRGQWAGNGDFLSHEVLDLCSRPEAIVVTNPPFSRVREMCGTYPERHVRYCVVASNLAVSYKPMFRQLQAKTAWVGHTDGRHVGYLRPDGSVEKITTVWLENIHPWPKETETELLASPAGVLEVGSVQRIPWWYGGVMAVPVTFLQHWSQDVWDVVGMAREPVAEDGRLLFCRILIRRKSEADAF